jgi:hypothetical protein
LSTSAGISSTVSTRASSEAFGVAMNSSPGVHRVDLTAAVWTIST